MTTTLSAISATTPKSWVMNMTLIPLRRWMSRMSFRICAWVVTSSAVVGSSAMRIAGSSASAMAIITRCRWPPDSRNGYWWYISFGIGQTDLGQQLRRPLAARGWRADAMCRHGLVDLRAHGHQRVQRRERVLEDHRHDPATQVAQPFGRQPEDARPVQVDRTGGDADRLGQQAHDRVGRDRLARSGFAHHAEDLAARELEGDVLDGMGPFHAFGQA